MNDRTHTIVVAGIGAVIVVATLAVIDPSPAPKTFPDAPTATTEAARTISDAPEVIRLPACEDALTGSCVLFDEGEHRVFVSSSATAYDVVRLCDSDSDVLCLSADGNDDGTMTYHIK